MGEETEVFTADEIAAIFNKSVANNAEDIKPTQEEEKKEEKEENKTTDDNGTNQSQESGGGERGRENTPEHNAEVSPNVFSSIAKALKDEGVFPDLDIEGITDAVSFKKMFENQVDSRLTAQQKRISDALNYGVQPEKIQEYENTLHNLFSLKEENVKDESKDGENLRKALIYQFRSMIGFPDEKAKKEVEKSMTAGTDIEDALDALNELKKIYKNAYDNEVNKKKAELENFKKKRAEEDEEFKKTVKSKDKAFGSLALDDKMKEKIIDAVLKPKHKLPNGAYATDLQKYEMENHMDFLRYFGAFYALTDGFTDFGKLFNPVAQKAVKNGFSQLEDVLKGSVNTEGSMKLFGDNTNSDFKGGWKIDLTE